MTLHAYQSSVPFLYYRLDENLPSPLCFVSSFCHSPSLPTSFIPLQLPSLPPSSFNYSPILPSLAASLLLPSSHPHSPTFPLIRPTVPSPIRPTMYSSTHSYPKPLEDILTGASWLNEIALSDDHRILVSIIAQDGIIMPTRAPKLIITIYHGCASTAV